MIQVVKENEVVIFQENCHNWELSCYIMNKKKRLFAENNQQVCLELVLGTCARNVHKYHTDVKSDNLTVDHKQPYPPTKNKASFLHNLLKVLLPMITWSWWARRLSISVFVKPSMKYKCTRFRILLPPGSGPNIPQDNTHDSRGPLQVHWC